MFLSDLEKIVTENASERLTFDSFPYFLDQKTEKLLLSCGKAHMRNPELMGFTSGLSSSNHRILLRGPPDSELYQERLVRALANHLDASFLPLDSSILSRHDMGSGGTERSQEDDESHDEEETEKNQKAEKNPRSLEKGARVKFVGGTKNRSNLTKGQKGRILCTPKRFSKKLSVEFTDEENGTSFTEWCHSTEIELDDDLVAAERSEWIAALEVLREFTEKRKPLVVYFPEPVEWFQRAVTYEKRKEFLEQVDEQFDNISGCVLLIASQITDTRDAFYKHIYGPRRPNRVGKEDIYELFRNTVKIYPPTDEEQLKEWNEKLKRDKIQFTSRKNTQKIQRALELYNLDCQPLSCLDTLKLDLSVTQAEKVVGWAFSHYVSTSDTNPTIANGKLCIPLESLQGSLSIFKDKENKEENIPKTLGPDFSVLNLNSCERRMLSCIIPKEDIGISFSDIGALEDAKETLKELVILPLQRPELFKTGNLAKACRGVLLFGPPGTGKTLLAKAVATEAGANFLSITSSAITSKWYGEAEKQANAVFTLARKISPTVIFVDEVDSLLTTRGSHHEHEASRKVKNEFMAAWDGLRTKDDERIIVLAATNRPFDLDDAVIRRLPRRILIELPDWKSRVKILEAILAKEKLVDGFDIHKLASMTEGYSGSDLRNLSIAAAYRPIRDLLSKEKEMKEQGVNVDESMLRGLSLEDFKQSMAEVSASVASEAQSIKELRSWNNQYGSKKKVRYIPVA